MNQNLQGTSETTSAPAIRGRFPGVQWLSRVFENSLVQIAVCLVLVAGVMAIIQFSGPAILDNDGYYHIRWSRMLWESAPRLPEFTWLPLTTLNERDYADHHFLFHVFLIPFTFGDLRLGAKLAAVVFSTLALTGLFAVMVSERIRYRWLWLAPLVASSEPFLYRMSMTRAPSLSLAILAVCIYLMFRRKLVLLGIVSFFFVWSYSLFPLVIVLAVAHATSVYVTARRIDFGPLVASGAGVAAGILINPYFPRNVALFGRHLVMKATDHYAVDVGVEWYPYDSLFLLKSSAVAFVIFFAGLLFLDIKERGDKQRQIYLLIVSGVLLVMTFWSRRFVEYWPPLGVLFAAFTFHSYSIGRRWFRRTRDQVILALSGSLAATLLVAGMAFNIVQAAYDIHTEDSPYRFRGASEWLKANTPADSIVFNTDWDDFPILFYENSHNRYIVGLDPTYLYASDHELWKLYASVTLGEERDAAPIIRERFGAEYVITDNGHSEFLDAAAESGRFETVYSDAYANVLRVKRPDEPDSDSASSEN